MDSKKIRVMGMVVALVLGIVAGRVHADALGQDAQDHPQHAELTQDVGQ